VGHAAVHVVDNAHILKKVYFPRLFIPLAVLGYSLLDFGIGLGILLLVLPLYGYLPGPAVVLLPLVILAIVCGAIGVGVFFSALTGRYRDFRFIVQFFLQLWLYLSPVMYPVSILPQGMRKVLALNPLVGLFSAFRGCIFNTPVNGWEVALAVVETLALFFFGLLYFRQVEESLADII
jgi:lipopolysaccharide transport system permease protein